MLPDLEIPPATRDRILARLRREIRKPAPSYVLRWRSAGGAWVYLYAPPWQVGPDDPPCTGDDPREAVRFGSHALAWRMVLELAVPWVVRIVEVQE